MNYVAPRFARRGVPRARRRDDAVCLAGGQSLVAAMNLGSRRPARWSACATSPSCAASRCSADGGLRIGAMTTHAELAALRRDRRRPRPAGAGRPPWSPIRRSARAARSAARSRLPIRPPTTRSRCVAAGAIDRDRRAARLAHRAGAGVLPRPVRDRARQRARSCSRSTSRPARQAPALPTRSSRSSPATSRSSRWPPIGSDAASTSPSAACGPTPIARDRRRRRPTKPCSPPAARSPTRADPPSDHRASAAYRRRVLPELLRRAGHAAAEQGGRMSAAQACTRRSPSTASARDVLAPASATLARGAARPARASPARSAAATMASAAHARC